MLHGRSNWRVSYTWTSHVTHINKSCHTYEWVMSRIWISHVTHMNENTTSHSAGAGSGGHLRSFAVIVRSFAVICGHLSARVCVCMCVCMCACHVTHSKAYYDSYEWDMAHLPMSHVTHMNWSCHTHRVTNWQVFAQQLVVRWLLWKLETKWA